MKKPFEYLLRIPKEIEEMTIFPYAEEDWAVQAKIEEGSKTYIMILYNELVSYLSGDMMNQRVDLSEGQIQQLETALQKAMKKAEARFGDFEGV